MEALTCLNCQTAVEQQDAKVFAGVFLCPTCYLFAERLYRRGERELKQLLLVLQDAIRIALVEGRLVPMEGGTLDDIPKDQLINSLVSLQEKRNAAKRHKGSGDNV